MFSLMYRILKIKANEYNKTETDSHIVDKLVVTSRERESGRGKIDV